MPVNCGIADIIYQCAYFNAKTARSVGNVLHHKWNNSNLFKILRDAIITERLINLLYINIVVFFILKSTFLSTTIGIFNNYAITVCK